ncbi:MAG: hypothetical protein Hals2KO_36250 [Halioglobus sp.]
MMFHALHTALPTPRGAVWTSLSLVLLLVLACGLPLQAVALPDDKEKPIHITADKAVRDEKRGVTIYSGHVEMRQGSMELDADSLTIFHASQDADKIVARGNPARMRQRPDIDEGLVHAHAEIITYFRSKELIHLRTKARIEREDGTLVEGDSIDYFVARELIKAESDRNDQGNQIKVVIPPSVVEEGAVEETPAEEAQGSADVSAQPAEQPAADAPVAEQPSTAAGPDQTEAVAGGTTQGD